MLVDAIMSPGALALQQSGSLLAWAPILVLLGLAVFTAVMMVGMSHMVGPKRRTPVKGEPYESGIRPVGDTRHRFSVQFYMVAILFIVFDMEAVFLIPLAVAYRQLGLLALVELVLFVGTLLVGLVYAWKRGALDWD